MAEKKSNSAGEVTLSRVFDAPIANVWRALTHNDEMKEWFFELEDFKPEVGFEFQFLAEDEGMKYDHRCKITEVIPGKKLVYSWRYEGYEGNSLVSIELFAEGQKTRLELTHSGLETFPKIPAFGRTNFEQGWTMIIGENLKKFVETN